MAPTAVPDNVANLWVYVDAKDEWDYRRVFVQSSFDIAPLDLRVMIDEDSWYNWDVIFASHDIYEITDYMQGIPHRVSVIHTEIGLDRARSSLYACKLNQEVNDNRHRDTYLFACVFEGYFTGF